jgi:hypothetical protein
MKTVRRVVLLNVLAVAWVSDAHAECIRTLETMAERFARTALVFSGEVLIVETVIFDTEPFVYRVRFRVDQPYKGTTAASRPSISARLLRTSSSKRANGCWSGLP